MKEWVKWVIISAVGAVVVAVVITVIVIVIRNRNKKQSERIDIYKNFKNKEQFINQSEQLSDNQLINEINKQMNGQINNQTIPIHSDIVGKEELFYVNKGEEYNFTNRNQAENCCNVFGARLATMSDLKQAYLQGAEFCGYGFLDNGLQAYISSSGKCEDKIGIIQTSTLSKAGAICIGPKPDQSFKKLGIYPFRPGLWSIHQHSSK